MGCGRGGLLRKGAFCSMSLVKMPVQLFPLLWICVFCWLSGCVLVCTGCWAEIPVSWWGIPGREGELFDGTCLGLGWVTEGALGSLQGSRCIPAPCRLASPWAGLDAVHKSCQGLGEPAGSVTNPRAPKHYARVLLCPNLFITRGMAVGLPVIPASVNLCAVVL